MVALDAPGGNGTGKGNSYDNTGANRNMRRHHHRDDGISAVAFIRGRKVSRL